MLTCTCPHKPIRKNKVATCNHQVDSSFYVRLGDLQAKKKSMVVHDTECLYCNQMPLNYTNSSFVLCWMYFFLCPETLFYAMLTMSRDCPLSLYSSIYICIIGNFVPPLYFQRAVNLPCYILGHCSCILFSFWDYCKQLFTLMALFWYIVAIVHIDGIVLVHCFHFETITSNCTHLAHSTDTLCKKVSNHHAILPLEMYSFTL